MCYLQRQTRIHDLLEGELGQLGPSTPTAASRATAEVAYSQEDEIDDTSLLEDDDVEWLLRGVSPSTAASVARHQL